MNSSGTDLSRPSLASNSCRVALLSVFCSVRRMSTAFPGRIRTSSTVSSNSTSIVGTMPTKRLRMYFDTSATSPSARQERDRVQIDARLLVQPHVLHDVAPVVGARAVRETVLFRTINVGGIPDDRGRVREFDVRG